jgi:hypothetical protein
MKKIKDFINDNIILIVTALMIVVACIALSSCNPVKKVLKDENKMREVWEKGVLKSWCANDSVYVSDTTILLDTLNVIETNTDTVTINDTVRITKTELKYITKTVTIRDTTIVTDRSKENLLQKEVSKLLDVQIKLKQDIVKLEAEKKAAKKSKNKAWTFFWIVLAASLGWFLRKPIMKLIKPL